MENQFWQRPGKRKHYPNLKYETVEDVWAGVYSAAGDVVVESEGANNLDLTQVMLPTNSGGWMNSGPSDLVLLESDVAHNLYLPQVVLPIKSSGGMSSGAGEVGVESDNNLSQLVLGVGLVAVPLGFGLIISPPPAVDHFKRRAVVVAYYAAQAAEIFFGLVLVFISRKSFNSTGDVQPRRVQQMGKLLIILSFLPVLLTILLVKLAKYE